MADRSKMLARLRRVRPSKHQANFLNRFTAWRCVTSAESMKAAQFSTSEME